MKKHRNYKLNGRQIKHMQKCFEECGWKITWLSEYFEVSRRSILFHVRTKCWVRRIKASKVVMPPEIAKIFRDRKKMRYQESTYEDTKENKKKLKEGSYEYIRHIAEQQRHKNCQHVRWIKRCSFCAKILESDSINHQHTQHT